MGQDALLKWKLQQEMRRMVTRLLTLDFLRGRRTQLAAVVIAGLTLALNLGWVDQKAYTAIVGFLTSVGLITASVHKPPTQ